MASTNDVFELRLNYNDGGDRMQSVLTFTSGVEVSATPEQDAQALAQSFAANIMPTLMGCFPVSTYLTSLQARRVNNLGGPSYYGGYGTAMQGTVAASAKVDGAICALLTAGYDGTLVGGPTGFRVARCFMGAVPFTFLSENQWSDAAVSAYSLLAGLLNDTLPAGALDFNSVVWSRKYQQYTPLTVWQFVATIAALRKRAFPAR